MAMNRRSVLKTSVAVAAVAAAPRAFAQPPTGIGEGAMPRYQKGDVRIHYEEAGSGFPLLIIPGGGQNSTIGWIAKSAPFNAIEEFKSEYRCITADLRNAPSGQSSGPLEIDRPWDSYTDDQLGPPRLHAVLVHGVRFLAEADGLRHDGGDDAPRRALEQLPDERTADAVTDHHEALDA